MRGAVCACTWLRYIYATDCSASLSRLRVPAPAPQLRVLIPRVPASCAWLTFPSAICLSPLPSISVCLEHTPTSPPRLPPSVLPPLASEPRSSAIYITLLYDILFPFLSHKTLLKYRGTGSRSQAIMYEPRHKDRTRQVLTGFGQGSEFSSMLPCQLSSGRVWTPRISTFSMEGGLAKRLRMPSPLRPQPLPQKDAPDSQSRRETHQKYRSWMAQDVVRTR